MKPKPFFVRLGVLGGLLGFLPLAQAEDLSLTQARALLAQSPKMAAAQAAASAASLQSEASQSLGGPVVMLRGSAMRYRVHQDISTDAIQDDVANVPIVGPIVLPKIPDNVDIDYRGSSNSANVVALWPVYAGGRIQAAKQVMAARADEAQADTAMTAQELTHTLNERYFGSQLAVLAASLHDQAVATIGEYDHTAKRMLDQGLIARADRLQASAKLADAQTAAHKAHGDARLAQAGLQRMLSLPDSANPTTPLFVNTRPVEPLSFFQDMAMQHHPGLEKVAAKKAQAEALHAASKGRYLPSVNLFGVSDVTHSKPTWVAGVSASWTLLSSIDRRAMNKASAQQVIQAQKSDEDVRQNILLLVEKNWRALDDARQAYINMGSNVQLYKEVLRLRRAGLRQGVNTVVEVMEAETQFLKAKTERAKVANDYVQALTELLNSCGQPQLFDQYMARADVRLTLDNGRLAKATQSLAPTRSEQGKP